MVVGAAQIPANHTEPSQDGAASRRDFRVLDGPATTDGQWVEPQHEGTGPRRRWRRESLLEAHRSGIVASTENPERARRKPDSLGVSRGGLRPVAGCRYSVSGLRTCYVRRERQRRTAARVSPPAAVTAKMPKKRMIQRRRNNSHNQADKNVSGPRSLTHFSFYMTRG